MKFRALALATAAGALLAAGCASTPGAAPPAGPERFVAKVQAAGFGNKDLAPPTGAQLRQVGGERAGGRVNHCLRRPGRRRQPRPQPPRPAARAWPATAARGATAAAAYGGRCASPASRARPACLFRGVCRGRTGAAAGSPFPAVEDGGDASADTPSRCGWSSCGRSPRLRERLGRPAPPSGGRRQGAGSGWAARATHGGEAGSGAGRVCLRAAPPPGG